jgi:hypothetical protein
MVITIPAFETLEKVNRCTNSSFKPSLGCSSYSSAHGLAAASLPTKQPICTDPTYNTWAGLSLLNFHSA